MFAVWLLANKRDSLYLNRIIKNLSCEYDAPEFIAHITAYGTVDIELSLLEKIVETTANLGPFTVRNSGFSFSDDIWKSLYIEIRFNKELDLINQRLTQRLCDITHYKFIPHISLIYKRLSLSEKEKIIHTIKIKKEFTIDKIAILKFSRNISKWTIVKIFNL